MARKRERETLSWKRHTMGNNPNDDQKREVMMERKAGITSDE